MIDIVYISKDIVVVNKPSGMPSESDPTGSLDALTATKQRLREISEPTDLWLVHRLDRVVGGLLAFARTKTASARLSADIQSDRMKKCYLAVTEGVCPCGELVDYVYKDSRLGRSFITDANRSGAKRAVLLASLIKTVSTSKGERSLVSVQLMTGRFHQIRAQLSHRGAPLSGDKKYGGRDRSLSGIGLFAYRLSFYDGAEMRTVFALPDVNAYPWSLFDMNELETDKI